MVVWNERQNKRLGTSRPSYEPEEDSFLNPALLNLYTKKAAKITELFICGRR